MLVHPSGDWNVFKQIFADHWEAFQHAHPRYQTSYYDALVAKRLDCGNPAKMGYIYRSHCTDRLEYETVPVATFIGRMVQHTLPKGFKRIRYSGVQASKTFAKVKAVIQAALAKVEGAVKGAVRIIARLTYRQWYEQSSGKPRSPGQTPIYGRWHIPSPRLRVRDSASQGGCQPVG